MNLYYRSLGEQGKVIIILHGLFGSSDNWLTVGKKLSEHHRVYLLDQRNHGQSFHDDDFTYDAMALDLHQFVQKNKIKNFVLIGHSMGGKVAMQYASRNSIEIETLIVVDIAPKYYPVHHQDILSSLASINLETLKSRNEANQLLSKNVPEAGTRQFLLKNLGRDTLGKFRWKINLTGITQGIENVGEALSVDAHFDGPTLFIRGAKSNYILDTDFAASKVHFPDSALATIPDAGHWVHAEQPEKLLTTIEEFIHE